MYTMIMGETGQMLYHPGSDDYTVAAPKMIRKINAIATLTFTIYPNNPQYDSISLFTSRIKVYKDGVLQMIFRPVQCKRMFGGGKEYTCEELLGIVQSILLRPEAWGADKQMGDRILYATAIYSANISAGYTDMRVSVDGAVTTGYYDNDLFEVEGKYALKADYSQNLWDEWQSILGGYKGEATILVRYLDVPHGSICMQMVGVYDVRNIPDTSTTTIEYGKNLEDLFTEVNLDDEFFTRLIPLGKDKKAAAAYKRDGGDSKVPLTIEAATNKPSTDDYYSTSQGDFIDIIALRNVYGVIEKTKKWEEVSTANALVTKAVEYLDTVDKTKVAETVTLSYWDLKAAGYDIADINYMEYVRVVCEPMGIDATYLVTEESVSLAQPDKKSLTLGKPKKTLTDLRAGSAKATKNKTDNLDNRVFSIENP